MKDPDTKEANVALGKLIDSHSFTMDDQLKFAAFSADANPIHIDPVAARRSIAGECIVHGIHGLLYSLDSLIKCTGLTVKSFQTKFLKPIPLNVLVHCYWDSEKSKLTIANDDELFTSISIDLGEVIKEGNLSDIETDDPLISPKRLTLQQCAEFDNRGVFYRGDASIGKLLFPDFCKNYGEMLAVEIALTSEIVGMQIPGLNSLFLGIKGDISNERSAPSLSLLSCDDRFGIIKLLFQGSFLRCEIDAFYSKSSSNSPCINQIAKVVEANKFAQVNGLIIGGSRGLGALTAKIISSGGGTVTISYNQGESDARKLQEEIVKFGGTCDVVQLRIEDDFLIPEGEFTQIYYFPTPKIKAENSNNENRDLLELYKLFYVDGFRSLLTKTVEKNLQASVFYPSTTYIDNPSKNFSTYVDAKLKGEYLCKEFAEQEGMKIIYPRLPRLPTDQTLGLMPEEFRDPVDVMYPLILRMLELSNNSAC